MTDFDNERRVEIILDSCSRDYVTGLFQPKTPLPEVIIQVCRDYGVSPQRYFSKYSADRRKGERRIEPTKVWDGHNTRRNDRRNSNR